MPKNGWTLGTIIKNNLFDDFLKFVDTGNYTDITKQKINKFIDHVQYKLSLGKNFYAMVPVVISPDDTKISACMFKSIPTLYHYEKDRLFTIREWLTTMGFPYDFEMYGDINRNYPKIGQNVPVKTSEWIVRECVNALTDNCAEWYKTNVLYVNNIKQKTFEK